ncbi:MAG TPA: hypothetical protein EYH22_02790 [Candidatus Nanopusillus sp.]|nr:hypothetical protein [Candidatus Nanopusillus sp.]
MKKKKLVKVSSGNRITIPKEACEVANIKSGDFVYLDWSIKEGKLILTLEPVEVELRPRYIKNKK